MTAVIQVNIMAVNIGCREEYKINKGALSYNLMIWICRFRIFTKESCLMFLANIIP